MKKTYFILVLAIVVLSSLQGCGGDKATYSISGDKIEIRYATLLSMEETDSNTTVVTIKNPWDTASVYARYVLVERGSDHPKSLPPDTKLIEVPVMRSVVYSGLHTSLINELGRLPTVKGMCDIEYVTDSATLQAIKNGDIKDCGKNSGPILEKILSLRPEIILLSPFENSDDEARYKSIKANLVKAADYMEPTPLGRAEWIRFYGRLVGEKSKADSLFYSIEKEYLSLRSQAAASKNRPKVIFDKIYSGIWYVPTSGSVTGRLIEDAGGRNPFSKYDNRGSAALSAEEVLHTGRDADIWLIRTTEPTMSMKSIAAEAPIYAMFDAFKKGNVYIANTISTRLFDDGAFHPEKTLREMIRILHPEVDNSPLQYYKKAN